MEQIGNNSGKCSGVWHACGYVRLSHEDGDREESNSVTAQKELIRHYFTRHPEMIECGMRVDDGFSGSGFDRPAFQAMMADVKAGKIDCIVVKDLSRFGRNYLDAGEYMERIFPFLGVRFIAINDCYDSLNSNKETDSLMIPFKNLINEAFCRDTSVKIRSQLEIKRRRGDFTGAFAVYGYLKDPENKNHLVADTYAADVVRDIFRWKMDGISAGDIADRLNVSGILAPMDYKKSLGMRFSTPFRTHTHACWNAATVLRILKNAVYTGVLVQGKNTTPSYKVKRRIVKPCAEWNIVKGTHEAIISPDDFEIVQNVLARDTRTSPGSSTVELFSGIVYCGECGASMIRKTVPSQKKKYVYYVCAAHKNEKICFAHSIRDSVLENMVFTSANKLIWNIIGKSGLRQIAEAVAMEKSGVGRLQDRLDKKREEVERYRHLLHSLFESLTEGVIGREEYGMLKRKYAALLTETEEQADHICAEMEQAFAVSREADGLNIAKLDRTLVVLLIARIFVFRNKRVEIVYNWSDAFWYRNKSSVFGFMNEKQSGKTGEEAV